MKGGNQFNMPDQYNLPRKKIENKNSMDIRYSIKKKYVYF